MNDIKKTLYTSTAPDFTQITQLEDYITEVAIKLRLKNDKHIQKKIETEKKDKAEILDFPEIYSFGKKKAFFLTEVNNIKEERKEEFLNIKNTSYPGFDERGPTILPNKVKASAIVADTFNEFKRKWKSQTIVEGITILVKDCFWWYFLSLKEQKNSETPTDAAKKGFKIKENINQEKIFHRLSLNYRKLFDAVFKWNDRDDFLLHFVEKLSEAIYCCFCQCFPDSIQDFNLSFKICLVNKMSVFFLGFSPKFVFNPQNWKLEAIKNKSLKLYLENESKGEKKQDPLKKNEAIVDFIMTLDKEMLKQNKSSNGDPSNNYHQEHTFAITDTPKLLKKESSLMGNDHEGMKIIFDLNATTPLISNSLLSKRFRTSARVWKTDLKPQSEENRETYANYLRNNMKKSIEKAKTFENEFKKLNKEVEYERERIKRDIQDLEQVSKSIMSRPWEIREISEQICELVEENQDDKIQLTSNHRTVPRVSTLLNTLKANK